MRRRVRRRPSPIDIARPRAEVAAHASDPGSATNWYENIKSVVWQTDRPLAVGTKLETTYTWEDTGERATRMFLRNRGQPSGFARYTARILAAAMRRANQKDLERLKAVLEAAASN